MGPVRNLSLYIKPNELSSQKFTMSVKYTPEKIIKIHTENYKRTPDCVGIPSDTMSSLSNNNHNNINIVFFARHHKDPHSHGLLERLDRLPSAAIFKRYCVVDEDVKGHVKNEDVLRLFDVTEVPTLYVAGTKLVGYQAMDWVDAQLALLQDPPPAYTP